MKPYHNIVLVREVEKKSGIVIASDDHGYKDYIVEKVGKGVEDIKKGMKLYATNYHGFKNQDLKGMFLVRKEEIIGYE